jgi:hypothetical protein
MFRLPIPPNAKTVELSNSTIWFDEDGILNSRPKEGPPIVSTRMQMEDDMEKFQAISKGKKVLMLLEAHPRADTPPQEDRQYIAEKLAQVTRAMAILTPSAVSMMVTNVFFLLKPPPYPMKMFMSVSEARKWLVAIGRKGPQTPLLVA